MSLFLKQIAENHTSIFLITSSQPYSNIPYTHNSVLRTNNHQIHPFGSGKYSVTY